ncbi:MAG: NAD(P)/FAD-dependent oxidoreductase [Betaproteobacteria bacterium]
MSGLVDLAVVCGGVAAYVAALEAASAGMRVLHLAGSALPGGLVANLGALEGYPGAPSPVSGAELIDALGRQGLDAGVERVAQDAQSLESNAAGFALAGTQDRWQATWVVAATGAALKPLSVPGAERFVNRGLLQCAWCNAGLFRGRRVVVVGAGDSALQEALHLARYAESVVMVVRGDTLRARPGFTARAADVESIEFRWESELLSIEGSEVLVGVMIRDRHASAPERIDCDAVFAYVGLSPSSGWLGAMVDRDAQGAVIADSQFQTRTPRLYAVGALRSGYSGRLVVAMGEATLAAQFAAGAAT